MNVTTTGLSEGDFHRLHLLYNGVMQDIVPLLGGGGGGGGTVTSATSPLTISNGVLSLDLSGFATAASSPLNLQNGLLTIDLSQYSSTSQIVAILASYVTSTSLSNTLLGYTDTTNLTALLAAKISTSHPANNIGSAAVNFGAYPITASALTLTNKNLTQGGSGELLWNNQEVQLRSQAFHQINAAAPLSVSLNGNNVTLDTLWKPSTVTGTYITTTANDANGTLALAVDTSQIATVASVNAKQDSLTAGANITLSNNVLSAAGDVTLAYVTANFLSPLNPGTVGVTQGLSSVLGANSFVISVDETTDSRTQFILRDSGNTARLVTANTAGQLLYNNAALATETQLASKQDTLTTGDGISISGNTISGYSLRWDTNNTPSGPIDCLHFKNLDVVQNLNLNTSQIELVIEHPAAHSIAEVTGLQNEVDKITNLVPNGISAVSLGTGQGASQRMAVYEIEPNQALTAGHYFYGVGLFEGQSQSLGVGLGLWGGTGTAFPDQFGTGGRQPDMLITFNGLVGIGNRNPSQILDVTGNINCSGTITGATKSFDIVHPDPTKASQGYHMRHWCLETADSPGGSLIYRRTIDMASTNETLQMPNWFSHLTKEVTIHMTPFQHFGSAWGECTGNTIELHSTTLGKWHVLIMANRNDDCANACDSAVEYIPEAPPDNGEAFPSP